MKPLKLLSVLLLSIGLVTSALADRVLIPYENQTEDELVMNKLATPFRYGLSINGYNNSAVTIHDTFPDISGMSMGFAEGQCWLVISLRPNEGYREFKSIWANVPQRHKLAAQEAILAHEAAHCIQFNQEINAGVQHKVLDGERSADAFALFWTARNRPESFMAVYAMFKELRAGAEHNDPEHDSNDVLNAVPSVIFDHYIPSDFTQMFNLAKSLLNLK